MIGRLRGIVDGGGADWALIDVNGVGYMVEGSTRLLAALPPRGAEVTLAIETHVRETELRLFGFLSEEERGWFRLLLSVQGVGAKVALAIQGTLSTQELGEAIAMGDKQMVARTPGVGPKVAQRIVQELKDKAPDMGFADIGGAEAVQEPSALRDALSALTNLGYRDAQARAVLKSVATDDADVATLIRLALKELAQ